MSSKINCNDLQKRRLGQAWDIAYTLRSNAMWFKECVFEIFLSERQLRWRMIMSVDSIGRRNTCLQSTCRSLETQCLSRTLIQA
jgi:hypothetical protein